MQRHERYLSWTLVAIIAWAIYGLASMPVHAADMQPIHLDSSWNGYPECADGQYIMATSDGLGCSSLVDDSDPFSQRLFEWIVSHRAERPMGGVVPNIGEGDGVVIEMPHAFKTTTDIVIVTTHGTCDDEDDFETFCKANCAAHGHGDAVCNVEFQLGSPLQSAGCGEANGSGGCVQVPAASCYVACHADDGDVP